MEAIERVADNAGLLTTVDIRRKVKEREELEKKPVVEGGGNRLDYDVTLLKQNFFFDLNEHSKNFRRNIIK